MTVEQQRTATYEIIKGSSTQYTIKTQIENIDICITQHVHDKTMMICMTDCGCFRQWIVSTRMITEVRFGITNKVDPFGTSMGRMLMGYLDGVDQLILGIGIKETSREKLLLIVEHIKIVMAKALLEIRKIQQEMNKFDDDFDDDIDEF